SSAGIVFITLDPFEERKSDELYGLTIAGKLQQKFMTIPNAFAAVFPPPSVRGLGTIGGFKLQVEDRTDQGIEALNKVMQELMQKAHADPRLTSVFTNYKISVPQLDANLDRTRAKQLGLA